MKINLEINNTTNSPIGVGFLKIAENTFAELEYDFLKNKTVGISMALVLPEEIKKINKKYRKCNNVTDILSFPEYKNVMEIKKAVAEKSNSELFLGELILCYDDIKEYADKEKLYLAEELSKIIAHGILHLLGFEHGERMFAIQNKVKNNLI